MSVCKTWLADKERKKRKTDDEFSGFPVLIFDFLSLVFE
jgi:hypothetical protein